MAKEYVECLFLRNSFKGGDIEALFILKDRPAWQRNRLNLCGGAIEEGETPTQAVVREVKEETGLDAFYVNKGGIIKDRDFIIHCFIGSVDPSKPFAPREGETEQPMWINLRMAFNDKRLIPNLRVIIPMLRSDQKDWIIEDNASSQYQEQHKFSISVPTFI